MSIRTISGITIFGNSNDNYSFHNSKNSAYFSIAKDSITYSDPFGNSMSSSPCHIRINSEFFRLEKMGDKFRRHNGSMVIMMPKEQIQEIANKTFYYEGQFRAVDFLTFIITEEK
ncbi:MAG: hypothetical protein ABI892_18205 [Flavobacterium sp.]